MFKRLSGWMYSITKRYPSVGTFFLGLLSGFIVTLIWVLSDLTVHEDNVLTGEGNLVNTIPHGFTTYHYKTANAQTIQHSATHSLTRQKHLHLQKGEEVAHEMAEKVRIVCWVATLPQNHMTKAVHIRDTWGKRCDVLLFMSSRNDSLLPAIALDVKEGREHLFDKTKAAMKYIYTNYMDSVDWIFKADDDTFVVVENLKYLLSAYNASDPLYLGCRFKPFAKQGFMSGGAGYVLSKAALKLFVENAIPDAKKCLQSGIGNGEDVEMGICLDNVNVTAVDSRDQSGRERFFPYTPQFHLFPDHKSPQYRWYWDYQYYPDPQGLECCSDTAVSFHYVSPVDLYVMDYLVHTLRPYGTSLYYTSTSVLLKVKWTMTKCKIIVVSGASISRSKRRFLVKLQDSSDGAWPLLKQQFCKAINFNYKYPVRSRPA